VKRVIFACVHNAGRSQMARAFFEQMADPGKASAVSAGTEPGTHVHPEVLAVMREAGLDLSAATPQLLTSELAAGASLLVTMGCGERCPYVPGLEVLDWPLEDPRGQSVERVREIREDIRRRVSDLLTLHDWARPRS
jgi:arsenate reductase (thioredoxin)